jgi:hypothetical protein
MRLGETMRRQSRTFARPAVHAVENGMTLCGRSLSLHTYGPFSERQVTCRACRAVLADILSVVEEV